MLESVRQVTSQEREFEQSIRKFGEVLLGDMAIQAKLTAAIDNGLSRDDWVALYVSLASDNGQKFTTEQMKIAMQEQKQGKDKILPSIVQKWITLL